MPDAAPAPARVCPECGRDPRAGRLRAPWWFSRTGLPLWLAAVFVGAAVAHSVLNPARITQVMGLAPSGLRAAGLTVAQVQAAAAGDPALGLRVADAVLAASEVDSWIDPAYRLDAEAISGPGRRTRVLRLGWPVRWLSVYRVSEYADLHSLSGAALPAGRGTGRLVWTGATATATINWTGARSASTAQLAAGGLALALAGGASLMIVVVRVVRGRALRRAIGGLVALALAVSLFWVQAHESLSSSRVLGLNALPRGPLLVDARLMAATPQGRAKLAGAVAEELQGAPGSAGVYIKWGFLGMYNINGSSYGWPLAWVSGNTRSPTVALEPRLEFAHQGLIWAPNSLQWRAMDTNATQRLVSVNVASITLSLLTLLGPSMLLVCAWRLGRGRRLRRYEREGRCLSCGYEVGRSAPAAARAPEAGRAPAL